MIKKIKDYFNRARLVYQISVSTQRNNSETTSVIPGLLIEPDENYKMVFKKIENSERLTVKDAIRMYIATSSTLKAVIEVYQDLMIKKHRWTGTDYNIDQVNNYITQRMFKNTNAFQAFIKRCIYYYIAEIGVAIRTKYEVEPDTGEMIPIWEIIPSLDLVFTYINEQGEHDPDGDILVIGRLIDNTNRMEIFYNASKTAVENMNFVYMPSTPLGDKVFGSSRIAALLAPVLSKKKLTDLVDEYVGQKIDPHNILATDLRDLIKEGAPAEEVDKLRAGASEDLKAAQERRGAGKNLISPFPIEVVEISGLKQENLSGIEKIGDLYEPEILRASGVPAFMLGGTRMRSALGSNEARSALLLLGRRLEQGVLDFNELFSEAIVPVALYLSINEKIGFEGFYDDTEIQQVRAQIFKEKVEALDLAVKARLVGQKTAINMLDANSFDVAEYREEGEIDELVALPAPQEVEPEEEEDIQEGDDS